MPLLDELTSLPDRPAAVGCCRLIMSWCLYVSGATVRQAGEKLNALSYMCSAVPPTSRAAVCFKAKIHYTRFPVDGKVVANLLRTC